MNGSGDATVDAVELELKKAEVEIKSAEAAKQVRENREAESPQKQIATLVPDLTKVVPGSLEGKGEMPLFGTSLAQRATAAAADVVAARVGGSIPKSGDVRILVTGDVALASSDALYLEVKEGLEQLSDAADHWIGDAARDANAPADVQAGLLPMVAGVRGGAAAALPGALSLLLPHRVVSATSVTNDSLAAAAQVAGRLAQSEREPKVFHDEMRLLPDGGELNGKLIEIGEKRSALFDRKATLEGEKASADGGGASATELTVRIAAIDGTIGAIDAFGTVLRTPLAGTNRSLLTSAMLREQLHGSGPSRLTHVLFIKAEPGSAQQLLDHSIVKDHFSTVATSSVTYMLIDTDEGRVIDSGSVGGEAKVAGKVGRDFSVASAVIGTS